MFGSRFVLLLWGAFTISLSAACATPANKPPVESPAVRSLKERFDKIFSESKLTLSGTLGVVTPTETYFRSFGGANDAESIPNGTDSIFLIASNSKEFTATAILRLEEQGLLRTSDLVRKHLPEYPQLGLMKGGREATIEHLLHHTAGIPDAYETKSIKKVLFQREIPFSEFLDSVKKLPLRFTPGSKHEYSNTGYLLLGEIIRRASKMSYGAFLEREVFGPHALSDTSVDAPQNKHSRVAYCYDVKKDGVREEFLKKHGIMEPHTGDVFTDGNIFTTAPDLLKWVLLLSQGKVLSAESTGKMFSPSSVDDYGYGWITGKDKKGRPRFLHSGAWLAFESFVVVYPRQGTALVWLGNTSQEGNGGELLLKKWQLALF